MVMVFLKHNGSWDHVGNMFRVKGPTFMSIITGFMTKLESFCVDRFVKYYNRKCVIDHQNDNKE